MLAAETAAAARVIYFPAPRSRPSLDLTAQLAPGVAIKDRARYRAGPWRALVDRSTAHAALGWQSRYRWSSRGRISPDPG